MPAKYWVSWASVSMPNLITHQEADVNVIDLRGLTQPEEAKRLGYVEGGPQGRAPGIEGLLLAVAGDAEQTDAQFAALLRRAPIDGAKWNAHLAIPDLVLRIDAAFDHVARVPGHPRLGLRVVAIDLQIHPLTLRRYLEFLVPGDVLEVASDEGFGNIPLP